jgi:hypothetical protein
MGEWGWDHDVPCNVRPRGALWNDHGQRFGSKSGRKHVDGNTAMEIRHGPARSGGGEKKDDEETLIAIEGSGGDYQPAPASSWAVLSTKPSAYHYLNPASWYVYGTLIYIWF